MKRKFQDYTTVEDFKNFQADFSEFVKREELNILAREVEYFGKHLDRACSKDELMTRLAVFSTDVGAKLEARPTIEYVRKVLSAYDQKMDGIEQALQAQMSRLDDEHEAQNTEIGKLNRELSTTNLELDLRITTK